jgi:hypothetical protein
MTSTPTPANDPSARRRWIFVLAAGVIVGGGVALAVALSQGGSGSAPPPEGAGGADVVPLVEPQETFSIRVRWPGATAEEVDALVATPMAASLGGFEDIDDLEIVSRDGEAVAIATLARTVRSPEVAKIREGAARRVATRLPAEAEIIAFRGDLTAPPDHLVVLTSDALPPSALGLLAGGPVRARVEVLAGVTDVAALGVPAQEVLVSLDPARLNGLGLDVGAVVTAVRRPREVPGGAREGVDRGGLADLRAVVVGAGADGAPIRLSDVATISVGPTPGSGALRLDGRAVAGLAVHGDEKLTTDAIAAAVAPELPPSVALGWRAGTATAGHPAGLHVSLRLPAGSTEEGVVGALEQVEAAAARVPGKRSVLDWTQGPGAATLLVRGDWADRAAVEGAVEALRAALAEIPGILVRVAPLDARGFSPEPAPLVVTLSGEGAAALGQAADAVAEAIGGVVGVVEPGRSRPADRADRPRPGGGARGPGRSRAADDEPRRDRARRRRAAGRGDDAAGPGRRAGGGPWGAHRGRCGRRARPPRQLGEDHREAGAGQARAAEAVAQRDPRGRRGRASARGGAGRGRAAVARRGAARRGHRPRRRGAALSAVGSPRRAARARRSPPRAVVFFGV